MIQKRKSKSRFLIIGSFLIIFGLVALAGKYVYNYSLNKSDEEKVEQFFEQEKVNETKEEIEETIVEEKKEETVVSDSYDYVGVLEIPSIKFKRGFLNTNDKNNNLNKNIEVLQNSDMPDVENGLMAIAGHSGTGRIAFFQNLNKVKEKQQIYIYYKNIKYIYEVVDNYEVEKNGVISIPKDKSSSVLVLTTCSPEDDGKQVIVISKLIDKLDY